MNTTIRKFTYFLTACLLGCLTGHAYEQDNWYLHGPIDGNLTGCSTRSTMPPPRRTCCTRRLAGVGLEVGTSTAPSCKPSIPGELLLPILSTIKTPVAYSESMRASSPALSKTHLADGLSNGGLPRQLQPWHRDQAVNYSVQITELKSMSSNKTVP